MQRVSMGQKMVVMLMVMGDIQMVKGIINISSNSNNHTRGGYHNGDIHKRSRKGDKGVKDAKRSKSSKKS